MEPASVTSKGQITIPKELRVRSSPVGEAGSGFGMLKSWGAAVPADLDPATLVKPAGKR